MTRRRKKRKRKLKLPKLRKPIAPPSIRHKSKKTYDRKKNKNEIEYE